jgi:hypothetical protein
VLGYVVGDKVVGVKTVFDAQPATEANFQKAIAFRNGRLASNQALKTANPALKDKDLPPVPVNPNEFWSYEDPGTFNWKSLSPTASNISVFSPNPRPRAALLITPHMDRATLISAATQSFDVNTLEHLFVSGHSGGGGPLAAVTLSALTLRIPTSLWYLDAAYSNHGVAECRTFCENCSGKGKLGMKNTKAGWS